MTASSPEAVPGTVLGDAFFARPGEVVARDLLGVVLRRRLGGVWVAARIIETEAYFRREKASHSSLGRTPSREPMFMAPGTLYLYHARGHASLNVSVLGDGDAVLIKSAIPHVDALSPAPSVDVMRRLNPARDGSLRPDERLLAGQTLLCRALDLRVPDWTGRRFDPAAFRAEDVGHPVPRPVVARRLGIPTGRDEHLLHRWLDADHARSCTSNPLTRRTWVEGRDYRYVDPR